jgi:hypothetical protein
MAKKEGNRKTTTKKSKNKNQRDSMHRSIKHKLPYSEKRNEIRTKGVWMSEQR